jgi:putative endonuclease
MYYVYILRSIDNSLYIGQTNDLTKRTHEHIFHLDKAAKFTKEHNDFKLVYSEEFDTRLKSMRREKQLKGWTRAKKEALISDDLELLKKL